MRKRALSLLILIPFALGAGADIVSAQEPAADVLSGRVTDVAGKPVADARVISTAETSGVTRSTTTDASGRYKIFFPETAPQYRLQVKRMGFAPVQRTVTRRSKGPEQMTIDVEMGGAPLALSMVEINGTAGDPPRETEKSAAEASVLNPITDILALKDSLHLSAVQILGLTDVSDSLQSQNSRIYKNIKTLLAKSSEAGDVTQMAGSVAMMLEEASGNTSRAVVAAKKVLRPEQWELLPQGIRDRPGPETSSAEKQD
ncbi:MAG TPA: carboxypeptidase-like regulatory domain-containing protein [Gemmatimonadaceae bacterium]|jgi:hypothetical protein|nr:carboxypeptidase-like regulatory domain-containing protein [Gemmatimonadaceae bacterium]